MLEKWGLMSDEASSQTWGPCHEPAGYHAPSGSHATRAGRVCVASKKLLCCQPVRFHLRSLGSAAAMRQGEFFEIRIECGVAPAWRGCAVCAVWES